MDNTDDQKVIHSILDYKKIFKEYIETIKYLNRK